MREEYYLVVANAAIGLLLLFILEYMLGIESQLGMAASTTLYYVYMLYNQDWFLEAYRERRIYNN